MSEPLTLVKQYHHAWTSGDIEGAMRLVADDIRCLAPGGVIEGRVGYQGFLEGFAPKLTGVPEIAEFADGDRVALFYYPQTATTSTTPAAECFTVRSGLIVENVLIFDRLAYAPGQA